MVATTVGIDTPPDFPEQAYNEIHSRVGPLQPQFVDAFRHYAGAWNAVAFRFRSTAENDQTFQLSLPETVSPSQRYSQEVALFHFFANAVATLDSLAYGLYAIGAMVSPQAFPLTASALRHVQLQNSGTLFVQQFPTETLGSTMLTSATEPMGVDLREIRNALSHRVSSTRTFESSPHPGGVSQEIWMIDHLQLKSGPQPLVIDIHTTNRFRAWLAGELQRILAPARTFVHGNL